jgi:hypothetical protein
VLLLSSISLASNKKYPKPIRIVAPMIGTMTNVDSLFLNNITAPVTNKPTAEAISSIREAFAITQSKK